MVKISALKSSVKSLGLIILSIKRLSTHLPSASFPAKQRSDYSGIGYPVDALVKAIVCNLCDGIADKLDRKFTAAIRTGERFIFGKMDAFQWLRRIP